MTERVVEAARGRNWERLRKQKPEEIYLASLAPVETLNYDLALGKRARNPSIERERETP